MKNLCRTKVFTIKPDNIVIHVHLVLPEDNIAKIEVFKGKETKHKIIETSLSRKLDSEMRTI